MADALVLGTSVYDVQVQVLSSTPIWASGVMAATGDLKSPGREAVWVRVPPRLPIGKFQILRSGKIWRGIANPRGHAYFSYLVRRDEQ